MKLSCPHCGQHYDIDESNLGEEAECTHCGKSFTLQADTASAPVTHCPYCGGDLQPGVKKCRHCGEWLIPHQNSNDKIIYLICALLLGMIGIHNFVAGQKKAGIEKILLLLIALRIITVFAHPLGYTILVTEILWILTEIVEYIRNKCYFPLTKAMSSIAVYATAFLLLVSYIYGGCYQGEVSAIEASYSLAYSGYKDHTVSEAEKRMDSLLNWPLANRHEIYEAAKRGTLQGLEMRNWQEKHKTEDSMPNKVITPSYWKR